MEIVLTSLNSKYIHPNMALRILKNELNDNNITCTIKEYNIKQDITMIINDLLIYDIIAFSCYIWNISLIKIIINEIKKIATNKIIILGGPEVSYLSKEDINDFKCDYIICGEGEKVFKELIISLLNKTNINTKYLIDINNKIMNQDINKVDVNYFSKYTNNFNDIDLNNQLCYLETSRGCPYHCAYCLASLDNEIREINLDIIFNKINYLLNNKAKTIKLLDRTFNFNELRTNKIIEYIINNDNMISIFQFEITGELLKESTINLLNTSRQGLFRLEIGIQSINKEANKAIYRYQDNNKLVTNINSLIKANRVILHLDLIAGLPKEDLREFKNTFNFVFNLKGAELQLGILKLLKGTKLNEMISEYNYQFSKDSPYQLISNAFLSKDDLIIIEQAEKGLNRYYNSDKAKNIIYYLINKYQLNAFDLFYELGKDLVKVKQLDVLYQRLFIYLKDDNDYIMLFNNYYVNSKIRLKALTKISNKKEILKKINDLNIIKQENLYRYSNIEQINKKVYYLIDFKEKRNFVVKI
ncbi:MAG: DUF4080 domain-containing protein [Bacilli bacterium]|jgi:anaerobic magnesium-protoporphyrin IX monomethyl ester cyclase|nr:DUF4080 domain-containing protein [Bacilli bacterium]